jgi:hypothetical protein
MLDLSAADQVTNQAICIWDTYSCVQVIVRGHHLSKILKNTANHLLSAYCQALQEIQDQDSFDAERWKGNGVIRHNNTGRRYKKKVLSKSLREKDNVIPMIYVNFICNP